MISGKSSLKFLSFFLNCLLKLKDSMTIELFKKYQYFTRNNNNYISYCNVTSPGHRGYNILHTGMSHVLFPHFKQDKDSNYFFQNFQK